jgi:uncharacterized protein
VVIAADLAAIRNTPTVMEPAGRVVPDEAKAARAGRLTWPDRDLNGLCSSMYEGVVAHARFGPGPTHSFSYKVAIPLLDLAEVDAVMGLHPAWSAHRSAPVRFRREDFLGHPATSLDNAVRELVSERTGRRPEGPIALLANLRTWGWLFNPISLYFCAEPAEPPGSRGPVSSLVAEVENTPWHDRHAYVVGPPGVHRFAKELHVSPFLPMGVDYELRYTAPGDWLTVGLDVLRGDRRLLSATLSLRRRPLDRAALGHLLWHYPAMTHRVTAGIYAHAARLRLKGTAFFAYPVDRGRKVGAADGSGSAPPDAMEVQR